MVKFELDDSIVTIIVGIDGSLPPDDIQRDLQEAINTTVNQNVDRFDYTRDSVSMTAVPNPTREEREELGDKTLSAVQFDVNLGDVQVTQRLINAAHNDVVERMGELGFNVSGTTAIWEGQMR